MTLGEAWRGARGLTSHPGKLTLTGQVPSRAPVSGTAFPLPSSQAGCHESCPCWETSGACTPDAQAVVGFCPPPSYCRPRSAQWGSCQVALCSPHIQLYFAKVTGCSVNKSPKSYPIPDFTVLEEAPDPLPITVYTCCRCSLT